MSALPGAASRGPRVSAFRGPPPGPEAMGRSSASGGGRAGAAPPDGPLLHPLTARIAATLALVAFGALHWMQMLEPTAGGRALACVALAAGTAAALTAARRLRGAARAGALSATVAIGLALALLAGGVADEQLLPREWGALAEAISGGTGALAGARIPYRGLDEDLQLVIPLGGTVLTVVATWLACWPRRGGRTGFAVPALIALVALYAVPAVALILDAEFLRGALLAVLVVAFLRLERLRRGDAPLAAAVAAGAAVLALALAPALDSPDPWFDYEEWSQEAAGARSTAFNWDHDYAALGWPRDGRELLRIRSRQRAYWKADQLDVFDGRQWRSDHLFNRRDSPGVLFSGVDLERLRRWSFPIRVTVRGLRSETLPIAGAAEGIDMPGRDAQQLRAGVWSVGRPLRRGDAYRALVYVPQPSARDLEEAGTAYNYDLARYTSLVATPTSGPDAGAPVRVFNDDFFGGRPTLVEGVDASAADALERSRLSRAYRLSRRLLAQSATPYDYVQAIQRYLRRGFSYDEAPPPASRTLDGFLFRSKVGFCQQFSGAMALLLRLGGVPARVATGFAPGAFQRKRSEYVVRDFDAHSWVEAWFPGIGWVTFDPTPSAAPPRSQAALSAPSAGRGDIRDAGTTQSQTVRDTAGEPVPWALIALGGACALAAALLGRRWWRLRGRARTPAVSELERALRGAGDPLRPGMTLHALESRYKGSPPIAGYIAALRAQRYGPAGGGGPTAAQRRLLRAALARGLGPAGKLRTWLALPPRLRSRPARRLH